MLNDIQINDNMPEDLKAALNFLNARNVSLTEDPNKVDDLSIENDDDDDLDIEGGETVYADDDEVEEIDFGGEDDDVSDLNNMF